MKTNEQILRIERELIEAAEAVVGRWYTPKWKDEQPTAVFINRLRDALAALAATEPGTEQSAPDPCAPAILEALSYHWRERDDLTLEDAVKAFRFGYKEVRERDNRAMLAQIIYLMASAPESAPAQQAEAPGAVGYMSEVMARNLRNGAYGPQGYANASIYSAPRTSYVVPIYTHHAPSQSADQVRDAALCEAAAMCRAQLGDLHLKYICEGTAVAIESLKRKSSPAPAAPESAEASALDVATYIERKAEDYLIANSEQEHDTGATVFHYGEAGCDYYNDLVELAEEIRIKFATSSAAKGGDHV